MFAFSLSVKAYTKLVCHGAKYPHRAVNGLLIGTISKKDNCVNVEDTIPLFHLDLSLAPLLEVALAQVEIYASSKGLSIVGYYHGNQLRDDHSISETASVIGKKVTSQTDVCCLLMIDNENMSHSEGNKGDVPLKMYTYNESNSTWKEHKELSVVDWTKTSTNVKRMMEDGMYLKINDYDCHLEDINADWTNIHINKIIL